MLPDDKEKVHEQNITNTKGSKLAEGWICFGVKVFNTLI